jgi:plasmid stabilization system protein ParE
VTLRFRTAKPASAELRAAVQWYEEQRPGLGAEFLAAIASTLESIGTYPDAGAPTGDDPAIRRAPVSRFPYDIIYRHRAKEVVVLAFAHTKRRPGFWKNRVP